MADALTRVCGLPDLSYEDRKPLLEELAFVAELFARIDRGAGLCKDRGTGWTAAMERAEGADRLFAKLREWPILRRLLPRVRHLRHEAEPVIGRNPCPTDDVLVAESLLRNVRTFRGTFGEGWGLSSVEVRLDPDRVRAKEATHATAYNGTPLSWSDDETDHGAARSDWFWQRLREKLDANTWRRATALAERMGTAAVPCDRCGELAQVFMVRDEVMGYRGPFTTAATVGVVEPALGGAFREAFAALDMPAVRRLNPAATDGYCAACDASYCKNHLVREDGAEPHARCPQGHRWAVG